MLILSTWLLLLHTTNHLALFSILICSTTRSDENLFTFHSYEILLHLQVHFHQNQTRVKEKYLKFGYRINYKKEGMLAHSFDRFYVLTKFILGSTRDLKFSKLNYDNTCTSLDVKNSCDAEGKKSTLDLFAFCKKIKPYVDYYRKQNKSYNDTAQHILKNEIDLILRQLPIKQKHSIITTLVSSFIGLAYEGISSLLHNRRHKALHKAVKARGVNQQFNITNSCT